MDSFYERPRTGPTCVSLYGFPSSSTRVFGPNKIALSIRERIKLFRSKMHPVPQKEKVKLDCWSCKTFCSFIKMKTHKKLGSVAPWLGARYNILYLGMVIKFGNQTYECTDAHKHYIHMQHAYVWTSATQSYMTNAIYIALFLLLRARNTCLLNPGLWVSEVAADTRSRTSGWTWFASSLWSSLNRYRSMPAYTMFAHCSLILTSTHCFYWSPPESFCRCLPLEEPYAGIQMFNLDPFYI